MTTDNGTAPEADTLFEVRDDLDTLAGKLESFEDLFRLMAMHPSDGITSEMVGFHFSMMNLTCTFKDEVRDLVHRLMAMETELEKAAPKSRGKGGRS